MRGEHGNNCGQKVQLRDRVKVLGLGLGLEFEYVLGLDIRVSCLGLEY